MKPVFHPAASEEIVETAVYYEKQVPGLGDSFIAEIERVTAVLCDQPNIGQIVGEKFRRILLARFPHSLIYSIDSDQVWVVAISHHRRRPGYWQDRIDRF